MNLEIRQDATGRWYLMMSTKHRILSDPDGIYKSDRMTLEKDVSYIFISCFIIHQCIMSTRYIEPSTFRENTCTGRYQWTSWFDTNDPDQTQVDFQVTNHIQQLFPDIMCSSPTAIEVCWNFLSNYLLSKKKYLFLFFF